MADTKIKITEVQTTEAVSSGARVLITQDNNGTETLYRAPYQSSQSGVPFFLLKINLTNGSVDYIVGDIDEFAEYFYSLTPGGTTSQQLSVNGKADILFQIVTAEGTSYARPVITLFSVDQWGRLNFSFEFANAVVYSADMMYSVYVTYIIDPNPIHDLATIGYRKYQLTRVTT